MTIDEPGPFAEPMALDDITPVQAALRDRLASAVTGGQSAPLVPVDTFAPGPRPRIVDGIIVPASSISNSIATWVLIPVGEVASIGMTARAVGISPRSGRWLAVWAGDDRAEQLEVLNQFAADLARSRQRGHR